MDFVEKKFERRIQSLGIITAFVHHFASARGLDESLVFKIDLVVEELFTNMVKYNPEPAEGIAIALGEGRGRVVVRCRDSETRPFDPTLAKAVPVDQTLEKRQPGGLGLHIVRQMAETINYCHADGIGTTTVTFPTEKTHVRNQKG